MTTKKANSLEVFDWIVLILTAVTIIWAISSWFIDVYFNENIIFAYSFLSDLILVIWMAKGGAKSVLWNWLPPFWPWGAILKSDTSRWLLIIFMIIGTVVGFIQYVAQEASQKPSAELISHNSEKLCKSDPPITQNYSRLDAHDLAGDLLLSTSFELIAKDSQNSISPFILNPNARLFITRECSNSGNTSLSVIPQGDNIIKKFFSDKFDNIENGSMLSSSFVTYSPFEVSNFKSVKLSFFRYSTSNLDKKNDFNCGTSLNVYYRLNGSDWIHKCAYCGQHITETTGWRKGELVFDIRNANTIEFLFVYESLRKANYPFLYLIDDIEVTGQK